MYIQCLHGMILRRKQTKPEELELSITIIYFHTDSLQCTCFCYKTCLRQADISVIFFIVHFSSLLCFAGAVELRHSTLPLHVAFLLFVTKLPAELKEIGLVVIGK